MTTSTNPLGKLNNLHVVIAVLLLATVYVSVCNLAFAEGSMLHVSD